MQNETSQINYLALAQQIKNWAHALGFQAVGISDIQLDTAEERLLQWLAAGHHGTMDYMAKHGVKRARPAELIPGTQRIISVRMNYLPAAVKNTQQVLDDSELAFISRYALGRDYHKVMRKRLAQLAQKICDEVECQCRVFTDSAPILEVEFAQKAQLGWRGKHTLLLTRDQGSWFFLGEILIDLPLPTEIIESPNHCGTCESCLQICPTQAIIAPYQLDARRCISYLTIEFKGSIPLEFRPLIGNRIYGCDDCQLACPWNRFAQTTFELDFAVRHQLDNIDLIELFNWTETEFQDRLAGSAIHRIGFEQWLRNIAIALGNSPTKSLIINCLQSRLNYPSDLVQEHVQWALQQHIT
jgi:epoxyqueuosine reductase